MVSRTHFQIFRRGSTTYFTSTLFFPQAIREDVFVLYSFVRTADDYVDAVPQQGEEFWAFCDTYRRALAGEPSGDVVIDHFVELMQRIKIKPEWVDGFLDSMGRDLHQNTYETIADLESYLYGSSEVVGMMMARVMSLPEESLPAARALGKSMQFINFIRDIDEDLAMGRTYFPQEDLAVFGLSGLESSVTRNRPDAFSQFIEYQVERYLSWQKQADDGFSFIPPRLRIPVRTASDMYQWTAEKIRRDPFVVYDHKVKPSAGRIVARACATTLGVHLSPADCAGETE
ncbi:phytoene/squalene synthase family protein [Methanogenium marinum]|uniref:Phytoene/squalene synthase family protein n=1 Tax=Methanogenium marinum TaxID=348610 RepID=A0A9Q4KUX7_9EURY|nr:phytoene/squalene synthase family protein [Methanogenium marinum]MDE4908843.1 phytoene/squalene synthase family protein [Methanogenium marinum]